MSQVKKVNAVSGTSSVTVAKLSMSEMPVRMGSLSMHGHFNEELKYTRYQIQEFGLDIKKRADEWCSYIGAVKDDGGQLVPKVRELYSYIPASCKTDSIGALFSKLARCAEEYSKEANDPENEMHPPSGASLIEFLRYLPFIPESMSDLYVDADSGNFGVRVKGRKSSISMTMKENKEVLFTLIFRGDGVSKISGRAYIEDYRDSGVLGKLVNIVKEG